MQKHFHNTHPKMVYLKSLLYFYSIFLSQFLSLILLTGCVADVKNFNNYGPYTVDYEQFEYCAGPRSRNLTYSDIDIIKVNESYVANANITFFADSRIEELKIRAFAVENDQKNLLFNYKIDQPCQHYAFAALIIKYFGANRCLVKKGHYNFSFNLTSISRTFYGKSTFYGKFQTKSIAISKQGNILCWIMNNEFKKAI